MSALPLEGNCPVRALISPLSDEYFHGLGLPDLGAPIPDVMSDESALERAGISSVLIAKAAGLVVEPTSSLFGYDFKPNVPKSIRSMVSLQDWIQEVCHAGLTELIQTDPNVSVLSARYQDLTWEKSGIRITTPEATRKATLMFQQVVTEPYAWLRIAGIAAAYSGERMVSSQAPAYLLDKLKDMQLSARRDIALQNVRGAVNQAAETLGTMLTPERAEAAERFSVLSAFVLAKTDHTLQAKSFGELYEVNIDDQGAIQVTELEEGFGQVKPRREAPIACPASYRFAPEYGTKIIEKAALTRLLGASMTAMAQRRLFGEPLVMRRVALPAAVSALPALLENASQRSKFAKAIS